MIFLRRYKLKKDGWTNIIVPTFQADVVVSIDDLSDYKRLYQVADDSLAHSGYEVTADMTDLNLNRYKIVICGIKDTQKKEYDLIGFEVVSTE